MRLHTCTYHPLRNIRVTNINVHANYYSLMNCIAGLIQDGLSAPKLLPIIAGSRRTRRFADPPTSTGYSVKGSLYFKFSFPQTNSLNDLHTDVAGITIRP